MAPTESPLAPRVFQVQKHSWRGEYPRSVVLPGDGTLLTLDKTRVTNRWPVSSILTVVDEEGAGFTLLLESALLCGARTKLRLSCPSNVTDKRHLFQAFRELDVLVKVGIGAEPEQEAPEHEVRTESCCASISGYEYRGMASIPEADNEVGSQQVAPGSVLPLLFHKESELAGAAKTPMGRASLQQSSRAAAQDDVAPAESPTAEAFAFANEYLVQTCVRSPEWAPAHDSLFTPPPPIQTSSSGLSLFQKPKARTPLMARDGNGTPLPRTPVPASPATPAIMQAIARVRATCLAPMTVRQLHHFLVTEGGEFAKAKLSRVKKASSKLKRQDLAVNRSGGAEEALKKEPAVVKRKGKAQSGETPIADPEDKENGGEDGQKARLTGAPRSSWYNSFSLTEIDFDAIKSSITATM